MTSSWARHRLALVALGAVVVVTGPLGPGQPGGDALRTVDRTAAAFTSEGSVAGVVGTVAGCVGDPGTYTSGLLDAAAPLLRWSFPGGPATPGAGPAGTSADGLLVCDPVDLAAGGDAGTSTARALDLTGAAGGGASSAPLPTSGTATLLLWVHAEPGAADGELVSLALPATGAPASPPASDDDGAGASSDEPVATPADEPTPTAALGDQAAPADVPAPSGAPADEPTPEVTPATPVEEPAPAVLADGLVLVLAGDGVQLTQVQDGATTVLATAPLTRGVPHLVAASFAPAGDGTPHATLAVDDHPAGPAVALARTPGDVTLTVGARPTGTAAVARVDEVTVLPTGLTVDSRRALVDADRWWSPSGADAVTPAG